MEDDIELFRALLNYLTETEEKTPVVQPTQPKDLFKSLDLTLTKEGIPDSSLEHILKGVIRETPKTTSKLFFNQLYGGRIGKAILGDLLAVMLNNSMYTYKVAGPQVVIEKEVLNQIGNLINYPETMGGTFAAGGSMTNFMALLMARDVKDPQLKYKGSQLRLMSYTSQESHYSVAKNAAFAGLGTESVRKVATDEKGRMLVTDLERLIKHDVEQGFVPCFVNATAGTTVLGAFDPIDTIADICEQYSLWLHIDGAYCGGVVFSNKHKHLVTGVSRSNSFSVNAHKMLGTPLSCSILVTQDQKHLYDSFSIAADYLYQTATDDYNLGKTSLQCGRRNDALKIWTLWKAIGTDGLEDMVDHQFHLADVALQYVQQHPDYQVYSFDESISVCFNYKNIPANKICSLLYEEGEILVGYGSFGEDEFIRFITINSTNSTEDILHFFERMEQFCDTHWAALQA